MQKATLGGTGSRGAQLGRGARPSAKPGRWWRQLLLVLVPMVIGGAVAAAVSSRRERVYEASADVALERGVKDAVFDAGGTSAKSALIEARIATSPEVSAAVKTHGGAPARVTATPLASGDAIEILARGRTPAEAAEVANGYAGAYMELRKRQALEEVEAARTEIQRKLESLDRDLEALAREVGGASGQEQALLDQRIAGRRSSLETERGVFKQQLDQLEVAAALRTGGVRLIRGAAPPTSAVEPNPARDGAIGLALGLVTGLAVLMFLGLPKREPRRDEAMKPERRPSGVSRAQR